MARLVPTAAHQVGAAARPRAAVGRRLWVPTSRGGSGIETTIARVTRKAEGGRSLEVYVSSERRQRGSPARCLTPPSSFQVKPALLPQGLPREEDDPTLGIGEPEVFKASSQTLGFIYSLVFGPTLITLTIWMAPAWEGALGPGPVTNGLYTGARDIGSYSVGFGSRPMLGVVFIWAGGIGPLLVGQRNGPPRGLRIWTGSVSPCRALRSEFPVPEAHGSRIESIYKRLPKDASFLTTVRGMAGRKACDRDPSSWTGGAEIAAQGAASTLSSNPVKTVATVEADISEALSSFPCFHAAPHSGPDTGGELEGMSPQQSFLLVNGGDSPPAKSTRTSKRLAMSNRASILTKAMARKSYLREGGEASGLRSAVKSIINKSRLYGVSLGPNEAKLFSSFLKDRM